MVDEIPTDVWAEFEADLDAELTDWKQATLAAFRERHDGPTEQFAATSGDVALAGPDGRQATKLLAKSVRLGTAALGELTARAVKRLLSAGNHASADRLFTDDERQELADSLAATLATADLLGRARVRERAAAVATFGEDRAELFSDQPTPWVRFADAPVEPLPPEEALRYFTSLVPELGTDPKRFGRSMERRAFTLAETTDRLVLRKVKAAISDALVGGEGLPAVQDILDAAGVSPASPAYAETVFRTNMMSAFNTGSMRELQDPDVAEAFPVWKYAGIRDGRQRPAHDKHFNRYYPNATTFAEVRDSIDGEFSGWNCRCTMIPVDASEWRDLQANGARLSSL